MKEIRVISALLSTFIVVPIWYSLVYQILMRVGASDVMWLLYWVYVPVGILVSILQKLVEA